MLFFYADGWICSKQPATSLCSFYLAFSPITFIKSLVKPYNSNDAVTFWKNSCFILSRRSDFHMVGNEPLDNIQCISYAYVDIDCVKWSSNFRGLLFNVEMAPSFFKCMISVLFEFKKRPMPLATHSRLLSRHSTCADVFAIRTRSSL